MVKCKSEITEFKPEAFEFMERLDAGVDIDLFSKTIISVVGDEHHGHPVISGVTRNLFRAYAIYIYQKISLVLSHLSWAARMPAACDKKEYGLIGEKRMRLFICGSFT